ncbi:MAG: hypothetical protein RL091_2310, partial [Verrucomicrobiota bacterium]
MSASDSSPSATIPLSAQLDSSILHVLMDTIPDKIYFKDLQSRIVRNNIAHAKSLGVDSPADCIGKTDYDFFSRQHADEALRDEQQILRTNQPMIGKVEKNTMLDGSFTWVSTTKLPWRDESGKLIG